MKKILYIVGPTATGKTSLALTIAGRVRADLISADSRQVYKGMDIGTGKDIPAGFVKKTLTLSGQDFITYSNDQTSIWGYDLVDPNQDFSIAYFHQFAHAVIDQTHEEGKLPIIVGGTGLYLDVIENPPESISIPHDKALRGMLSMLPVLVLKEMLESADPQRLSKMNNSDANNPRRLIRAIEISQFKEKVIKNPSTPKKFDSLWIGLKSSLVSIDKSIENRVESRIKAGFVDEFESLYESGFINKDFQSSSSTGYKQWLDYRLGIVAKDVAKRNWITAEKQYARRQLTWFKKRENINWYDAHEKNTSKSVVDFVRVWYS